MKNLKILSSTIKAMTFVFFLVGSLAGCKAQYTEQVLADQEQRQEIMNSIARDSTFSIEMMNTMMDNEQTRQMMAGNQEIMNTIMNDQQMMSQMMMNNPEMRKKMMNSMMEDSQMMMEDSEMMAKNPEMPKKMMNRMMENPQMMSNMMNRMMENPQMMSNMMKMMSQKGMMSDKCLQSSMDMMKEKK